MLAPKCATYNGRLTFANPKYLKTANLKNPDLYEIPFDTSDPANKFAPEREETMTLDNESRSKLNKDIVKPYDYTKQNSLYQLERTKEVRKTMWRKPFDLESSNARQEQCNSEVKKLIENCKGKSWKLSLINHLLFEQPMPQRIPKPSDLGKPDSYQILLK
ncbi:hypothetical protein Tco_1110106 [Tanacetum coccineum]|uniref:Uncharacterized protein n=1 Tax=Tanacetum coccineum TaxID=301880 RepID=A0ABQ5II10_9ASTR